MELPVRSLTRFRLIPDATEAARHAVLARSVARLSTIIYQLREKIIASVLLAHEILLLSHLSSLSIIHDPIRPTRPVPLNAPLIICIFGTSKANKAGVYLVFDQSIFEFLQVHGRPLPAIIEEQDNTRRYLSS
jgi:hypothetical protein